MAKEFNFIKYIHGHVYYSGGVVASALAVLVLVQAILTHVGGLLNLAALEYLISALLVTIAYHYFRRGNKHYSYE